ncbi:PEP-utilizing enzyme [Nocardioides bizhenqiangii]|uniref:PEP-utilizing enzyme n=1 Tax=Nocardioides bizhenqiangii TaxID=3095076 RepID=A0ABZ0ZQW0_9ACTN|nr:PEP-utilizing enzyme [Nocardioides sp. HM61]WQQ25868.1 PEP-utilizing enzyme [Nocardioides sp. HM61]
MTRIGQVAFLEGFPRGFSEGTAKYGVLLDHLRPGFSQSFLYNQPAAVGAPAGAMGPPPKPVLQVVSRLHPEMRRRHKAAAAAIAGKLWRQDLEEWDRVDKPAAIKAHQAIQAVDVETLTDLELADHVDLCAQHVIDHAYLHHKYTMTACLPVGDFLAGAIAWTGADVGELMGLLRGRSAISRGFASAELDAAAKALTASEFAQDVLAGPAAATDILAALSGHPDVGAEVTAYLDAVRWRSVGYDVGDQAAGELPEVLVESLRSTLAGSWTSAPDDDSALTALRERVPSEHRDDFDDRLAEVRRTYRIRDERGVFSDGWATGLARRAMLETGRRLLTTGKLEAAEHAVELDPSEARALLIGSGGPCAAEVADRFEWRTTTTTSEAPEFLGGTPAPPPPAEWLPAPARRTAVAINTFLGTLFGVPDTPNTATVLTGLSVNAGVYEGPARLVDSSADFGRIKQGDVLVTRMTSPYFNVVLPMLGAIVTDRGGQLCHAAIVAREYGIPGIVGTRDATKTIPDGARVRVDGSTGEVRLLE